MMWETVIGLETHVELSTASKIFCACSTAFGAPPNTHCCPVCAGLPGALPALNEKVLEYAVKAGLALGCTIAPHSRFDRKNYFYPDLPKAYQISQLYLPIARNGAVELAGGKVVRISELHMEEDAGKLTHGPEGTLCDLNRCGVPLIEIVTAPDFRTAEEVISYLERLRSVLRYLGVSDCKLQEGSLRCDVNLSVRPAGSGTFGTRTELKNLASFRAIARAIEYERRRQIALLESGSAVAQETRRWDEDREESLAMHTKEEARDYRYFPEPDLPPLALTDGYIRRLRDDLPEQAHVRQARYRRDYGLSGYDAETLTGQKALSDFFEACVALDAPPKQCANWVMGEVLGMLSALGIEAEATPFSPATLVRLIALVAEGRLNRNTAVGVFQAVFACDGDVDAYIREHGLAQVRDDALIAQTVAQVFAENPRSVADYRAGKEKALGFLVGQTMRALKGHADPQAVNRLVLEALK